EKKWEARQQLLMRELSHRVNNALAVVQVIVTQTLRGANASAELQDDVVARLQAVSKSHDLVVDGEWTGAALESIVHEQLKPYFAEKSPRVRLQGPMVALPSEAATPFGLLMHELATNAAKYGALSTPRGTVEVRWEV